MRTLGRETEQKAYILSLDDLAFGYKSITAILNKSGSGEIYIGVDKHGTIFGLPTISYSTIDEIFTDIQKNIKPKIYPQIIFDSSLNIIKISFYGTLKPYSYKKDYYIRSYDENRELDYDSIMNEIKFNNQNTFYEDSKTSESPRDVNESIIKDIYARAGAKKAKYAFLRDALKKLNLLYDNNINLAGRYLFSKRTPLDIQANTYSDEQKKKVIKTTLLKGNIFELIENVSELISVEQNKSKNSKNINSELIKETLIFSFLNSSFNKKEPYTIHISPSEVTFKFPGTLFYLDSLEEYFNGTYKIQNRNRIISKVFNFAGYSSSSEKSLRKIEKLCKDGGVIYSGVSSQTNLTITYLRYSQKKKTLTLEQAILAILVNRPMIKADLLAKKLGKTRRTIQTSMKKLKESNLISRKGSNKNGYWIVNK